MGLSNRQWWRIVAGTVLFAITNALWMLFAFGKSELLSWHGVINVVVLSALFLLMMIWMTLGEDNGEDGK